MGVSLFALSGLFIAISSGVMVFVMFAFGENRLHRLWGVFSLSVLVWGLGGFFIGIADNPGSAELWWRFTHIGIAFIPVLFLHFVYEFLELKKSKVLLSFYAIAAGFALLAVFSDTLIANVRFVFNEFYYDSPPGVLYPIFTVYFFGLVAYSHYLLYRGYSRVIGSTEHKVVQQARIRYFFIAMIASFSGGSLSFLPVYGIDVYPITNFAVTVYPVIVGYAILRLRLFDIRVVTAQGLVLLLWLFVGIRLALSLGEKEFFLNLAFFSAVILLGVFLIRSVNREVKVREKIEILAKKLREANKHLKVLDQRKSEFLSLASHQLRSPLTAIKGYASMLVEGSYGEVSEKAKEPLRRILTSSNRLVTIVEDFLTISRIEQNRLKYSYQLVDFRETVMTVLNEFEPTMKIKGLRLVRHIPDNGNFTITADPGKVAQVVSNMMDNAVKYTPEGSITVSLDYIPDMRVVRLAVADTGIGMTKKTQEKLFEKFSRGEEGSKLSATGAGLGLYIIKRIVEAHRGKIWAESKGKGKGSTFYMELPSEE